jgi:hypothetical protein
MKTHNVIRDCLFTVSDLFFTMPDLLTLWRPRVKVA